LLAENGYEQYEVSAYARGAQSAHNVNYWRFGDYLGIGAGAHGKLSDAADARIVRTAKVKAPRGYLQRHAEAKPFGTASDVIVAQRPFEFALNALRLNAGVPAAMFEQRTGVATASLAEPLQRAHTRGWLENDPQRLRASASGRRFLNDLIELFLPDE
jgi:oxygen-independent coproporphyrinogen-3 oxidase